MYGLELRNGDGALTLSSEYTNYEYYGSALPIEDKLTTYSLNPGPLYRIWEWTHYFSIYSPHGYPLIFVEVPVSNGSSACGFLGARDIGNGYYIAYFVFIGSPQQIRIFKPTDPNQTVSGVGLVTRNQQGDVTFNAANKSLVVDAVGTAKFQGYSNSNNPASGMQYHPVTFTSGQHLTLWPINKPCMLCVIPSMYALKDYWDTDLWIYHYVFVADQQTGQISSVFGKTCSIGSIPASDSVHTLTHVKPNTDMYAPVASINTARYPLSAVADVGIAPGSETLNLTLNSLTLVGDGTGNHYESNVFDLSMFGYVGASNTQGKLVLHNSTSGFVQGWSLRVNMTNGNLAQTGSYVNVLVNGNLVELNSLGGSANSVDEASVITARNSMSSVGNDKVADIVIELV